MVNNGSKDYIPKGYEMRIVGINDTLLCLRCKITYKAQENEISRRNPNIYLKHCSDCRCKMITFKKNKEY